VEPKVTGEVEAAVDRVGMFDPAPGHARWSLRLLERQVQLAEDIPNMDHSTIGKVLKNGASSSSEEVLDHPARSEW